MKHSILTPLLLSIFMLSAGPLIAQTGIGTASPNPSAALDVQSTAKGLLPPRMSASQRNNIPNPPAGLLLFNSSLNCLEMNAGTPAAPNWICLETPKQASSNGTAVVNAYNGPGCTGAPAIFGTLQNGQVAANAYMLLYADVAQTGSWTLSAAANGITFAGKGNFTATGCQPVVLTASGIPAAAGAFTWTTNSSPQAAASANVNN